VLLAGVTVTVDTGTRTTVIALVPDLPSLVAVMVAFPGETAETLPVPSTVATDELDVVYVIALPDNALPTESRGVAVS